MLGKRRRDSAVAVVATRNDIGRTGRPIPDPVDHAGADRRLRWRRRQRVDFGCARGNRRLARGVIVVQERIEGESASGRHQGNREPEQDDGREHACDPAVASRALPVERRVHQHAQRQAERDGPVRADQDQELHRAERDTCRQHQLGELRDDLVDRTQQLADRQRHAQPEWRHRDLRSLGERQPRVQQSRSGECRQRSLEPVIDVPARRAIEHARPREDEECGKAGEQNQSWPLISPGSIGWHVALLFQ